MMKDSWARVTGKVGAQAKRTYTRGPKLAGPKHIHTTTDNRHYMVYLEQNSLPSACINTTTTKINGRMGDAGYCGEVYGASTIPCARPTQWNGDCSMVTDLQLHWQAGKFTACHKVSY